MANLPNILTIFRIILIPIILSLILLNTQNTNLFAFIAFIIASLSYYFDGYLDRKYNLSSNFGTMLVPIAYKLLVILVGFMLCYRGDINGIHLIPFLLIVSREIFISGIREYLAQLDEKISLPVSNLGKYKTADSKKYSSLPDVILIDGGRGHYDTVKKTLTEIGIKDIKIFINI